MKSFPFQDIRPCSSVKANQRFGGTYRLHLQGRGERRVGNHHEADSKQSSSSMACYSTLKMEAICSSEISVDFHGVISQKRKLFQSLEILADRRRVLNYVSKK
jgi:hypothetical protein